MPGHIAEGRLQRRQVFRQLDAPLRAHVRDAAPPVQTTTIPAGHEQFFPWQARARDAAPRTSNTIGAAHAQQNATFQKILGLCADIGSRISALEMKRAAQAQAAEQMQRQQLMQQRQIVQPSPPTTATHDRAPCMCQHVLTPQRSTKDGVNTMQRNSQLAPLRGVTFDPTSRHTRDQQSFGEQPSRFSSQEADRMANYLPPGSAGRTSTKEATNDLNLRVLSQRRDAKTQHNVSGPPGAMAAPSDPSSGFASELNAIPNGSSPQTALNCFNRAYHAARTSDARDKIERIFRDWRANHDGRDDNPWRPRQAEVHDAPWSGLYEANKGTIGGDPNKISPGMELSMPGGGTHTVQSGETLSGIASSSGGAGGGLGGRSLAAETGGVSPTGGNYSSGGQISGETGGATSVPSSLGSSAPTPPTRPAGLGGQEEASSSSSSSETPTPPSRPASLGGVGESSSEMQPLASGGESGTTGGAGGEEGTPLAGFVRNLVGDAKGKPPRGRK